MTYDDGILTIYTVANKAEPGNKPATELVEKAQYYFAYSNIGVTRAYLAKTASQEVSAIVLIPDWSDVKVTDICVLEDGTQYQIDLVQPEKDENGLRMMKLTLGRLRQEYEVPGETENSSAYGYGQCGAL